uniref:Uncharacterized protein n=1 Tax=Parascaris equorum TaxID=6256 RepID=A0A914S3G4_PAREQ
MGGMAPGGIMPQRPPYPGAQMSAMPGPHGAPTGQIAHPQLPYNKFIQASIKVILLFSRALQTR